MQYQNGEELEKPPEVRGDMFGVDFDPVPRDDDRNSVEIQISMEDGGSFYFVEGFNASWLDDLITTLTQAKKALEDKKRFVKEDEEYIFK